VRSDTGEASLRGNWSDCTIRDIALGIYDGPHATPKKTETGPVFLGISCLNRGRLDLASVEHLSENDFQKWTRRVTPQENDIVFSYETRIGEVAIVPRGLKCCLGRRMALVRLNQERMDPRFFLYYYLSPAFQEFLISRTIPGSTVDRILLTEFPNFPIAVPPLAEQQAIARILGALDDKIEVSRRMNRTLEAMAQAIFKSWFVDFDPVIAKREGRKPLGMDDATAAMFPAHFQDSAIGPIPAGWKVRRFPQAIEVNPRRVLQQGTLAPYLDMQNMPTASAMPEDWGYREVASGMHFRNHDTLIARITPCLENGKTAYISFLDEDQIGWGSTEYIVLSTQDPLPPSYAYFLARTDDFRSFAIANMTGSSGRQRVPVSCLDNYYIAVPDAPVATAFGCVAGKCLADIQSKLVQNRFLASLRDTLLPKLLSGEIRVGQAEKIVASKV